VDEASIIISAADDHALSDFEGIDCGVSARQRSAKLAGRYQVRRVFLAGGAQPIGSG